MRCLLTLGVIIVCVSGEVPRLTKSATWRGLGAIKAAEKGTKDVAKHTANTAESTVKHTTTVAHQTVDCATSGGVKSAAGCAAKSTAKDSAAAAKNQAQKDVHKAKLTGQATMGVARHVRRLFSTADSWQRANFAITFPPTTTEETWLNLGLASAIAHLSNVTGKAVSLEVEGSADTLDAFYNITISPDMIADPEALVSKLNGLSLGTLEAEFEKRVRQLSGVDYVFRISSNTVKLLYDHHCHDVTEKSNSPADKLCYQNVMWAMKTGIHNQPDMYSNYSGLNENSSFSDFQCVLHDMKGGDMLGSGWSCRNPCASSLLDACGPPEPDGELRETPAGGTFQLYAILLVGLLALASLGGIAYYFWLKGRVAPKKKKKRATKPLPTPAAAPAPKLTPAVDGRTVYAVAAQRVYVQPTIAQPVAMAQPVTYVTPMHAPLQTTVVPVSTAAAMPGSSSHLGVYTA